MTSKSDSSATSAIIIVKVFPKDLPQHEHIFEYLSDAEEFIDDQTDYWQLWEDEDLLSDGP